MSVCEYSLSLSILVILFMYIWAMDLIIYQEVFLMS